MHNASHMDFFKGHTIVVQCNNNGFVSLCAQVRNRIKRRCKMWRMKTNETTQPI